MSDILTLQHIRKSYNIGTSIETEVLHDIQLTLKKASFSALTGPSGSGKSTLLNIIGLLESPTSGDISINGQSTTGLSDANLTALRGQSLGFVFQFHHLLPAFTAIENVMMPAIIGNQLTRSAAKAQASALLVAVGLEKAIDKKPAELSGGMQQRVAIARALMLNPPLVLADEPTGNLDTQTADDIFAVLRRINKEHDTAFLVVTHDPRLAARCDQTLTLIDGKLNR
jgi:lipoprotein-releasing system ATP-binding protein